MVNIGKYKRKRSRFQKEMRAFYLKEEFWFFSLKCSFAKHFLYLVEKLRRQETRLCRADLNAASTENTFVENGFFII